MINICKEMKNVFSLTECIETERQHLLLKEFNCNLGQGYYYSRPVEVETFELTDMIDRSAKPERSQVRGKKEQEIVLKVGEEKSRGAILQTE